ncbi:hypothetical protein EXIGLDRAFT_737142 [Exidia glandulosa HHB12029]|uniref:Uncharacterized protein n=1 Tax=Exidia glandulosa HHB12029 TaxID=1314781 RepID=A0A166N0V0_EXIGL|nr:hypothetical protein EXIGLDRAFT_737142 [Exidia glandulosa HHB12029]
MSYSARPFVYSPSCCLQILCFRDLAAHIQSKVLPPSPSSQPTLAPAQVAPVL